MYTTCLYLRCSMMDCIADIYSGSLPVKTENILRNHHRAYPLLVLWYVYEFSYRLSLSLIFQIEICLHGAGDSIESLFNLVLIRLVNKLCVIVFLSHLVRTFLHM